MTEVLFLTILQVAARYNVDRTTIWRWGKVDATFPQPVTLSRGCVRWKLSDLEAWEASKANGKAA